MHPDLLTMKTRRRSQRLVIPAAVLLALLAVPPPVRGQRPDFVVPPWARLRLYGVADDSPMLRTMLRQPGFNDTGAMFISYVTQVDKAIRESLRNASGAPSRRPLAFTPCSIQNKFFAKSIRSVFGTRGLAEPTYDCTTDVVGTRVHAAEPAAYTVEQLYAGVGRLETLIDGQKNELINNVLFKWPPFPNVLANWSIPTRSHNKWERDGKACTLAVVGFMRVFDDWFFNVALDNVPDSYAPAKWQRQRFAEYVRVGPNGTDARALLQSVPTYVDDSVDGPPRNATTVFVRSQGRGWPSYYYRVYPESNPAINEAMSLADLPVRQAADALTASMLSILFLPLVLNLVPIALITPVSTRVMLSYMLCSDVLTVVPLFIKGIELVVIGRQRFRAVALRVENDINGVVGNGAAGQLWSAECRIQTNTVAHGTIFIVLSVAAVVFGILLELWARRFIQTRHHRKVEKRDIHWRIGADETYEAGQTWYKRTRQA